MSKQSQEVRIISLVYSKGFLSELLVQKLYYIQICNDVDDNMSRVSGYVIHVYGMLVKSSSHHVQDYVTDLIHKN